MRTTRGATRHALGARAEEAVVDYLVASGLSVLDVNVRVGRYEVDVLARDGEVIAVVEVRTRGPSAWQRPLASIDGSKRSRVRQAGERLWRGRFAAERSVQRMRFDAAAVRFEPGGRVLVDYVKAAF